jgi:hypothetical protein
VTEPANEGNCSILKVVRNMVRATVIVTVNLQAYEIQKGEE